MTAAPHLANEPAAPSLPRVSHGEGLRIWDKTGRSWIDGSGGPAVFCLGHGNREVNAAIAEQLDRIAFGYRQTFTSDPLEELTELVAESCGGGLNRMAFVTGGSEAVEAALKIALQYHAARGEMRRRRFVARQRSWHGNTLGALAVSGFRERRAPFEGALTEASFLSPANAYRPPESVAPDALAGHLAAEFEAELERVGPDTVAAFIFEPVVGAAGGVVPAPPGYARAMRAVCDRHGVLMIADEVMCGAGRCGPWRTLSEDGVVPDIMTVAKGLAGGYLPLGAAVYTDAVGAVLEAAHGRAMTGHTFTGHTACCAAGVAVQRIVRRDRLLENVITNGPRLRALLTESIAGIEAVGDIRGRGFFAGVELVADPESKAPFPADLRLFQRVRDETLARGLICYPCNGNVNGVDGDTVIFSPPYVATEADLAEIAGIFGESLRAALASVGR